MNDTIEYRTLFLIPRAGVTVINPETGNPVPPEGELMTMNKYTRRRMADGDLYEPTTTKKTNSKE